MKFFHYKNGVAQRVDDPTQPDLETRVFSWDILACLWAELIPGLGWTGFMGFEYELDEEDVPAAVMAQFLIWSTNG